MDYSKENTNVIKSYYNSDPLMEWERTNERTIEYIITAKMLERFIKPLPAIMFSNRYEEINFEPFAKCQVLNVIYGLAFKIFEMRNSNRYRCFMGSFACQ